jgi:hypothetical protein
MICRNELKKMLMATHLNQHSSNVHVSSTRGNKLDAVVLQASGGGGGGGSRGGGTDGAPQDVMLEITALSIEHQLFAHCCSQHIREENSIGRDNAIASKYKNTAQAILSVLRQRESAVLMSDLLSGAKHLRDVLLKTLKNVKKKKTRP